MESENEEPRTGKKRDPRKSWTPKLAACGFTAVVDVFLDHYAGLMPEISTTEAMLIIHLIRHKWDEEPPYPAFKRLATRMGISVTAVRGHARKLESKGYLRREKRVGAPNRFHLDPLFQALEKKMAEVEGKKRK